MVIYLRQCETYALSMVKRIGKQSKRFPHLYITEHMDKLGLNDRELGLRFDPPVSATTVWRWRREQWRLRPEKIAAIAHAMGLESHLDLYRLPGRESIDSQLGDAPDDVYDAVRELVRTLSKKAS